MTDSDHVALDAIGRAADDLLPQLSERLARHGLGEIEVVDGDLRVRIRAASGASSPPASSASRAEAAPEPSPAASDGDGNEFMPVSSPAVGFFVYAEGLGPGLDVAKGDALGHVEMLGVRHDVRAPGAGIVRNLVAESGEAVEYGQTVVEIETAEVGR